MEPPNFRDTEKRVAALIDDLKSAQAKFDKDYLNYKACIDKFNAEIDLLIMEG